MIAHKLGFANLILVYFAVLVAFFRLRRGGQLTRVGKVKLIASSMIVLPCIAWGAIHGIESNLPSFIGCLGVLVIWMWKVNGKSA